MRKSIAYILTVLILTACGKDGGSPASADAGLAPSNPLAPIAESPKCQGSAAIGSYTTTLMNGLNHPQTMALNENCELTINPCGSTWRLEGMSDNAFATTQVVQLVIVSPNTAYNAWCFRQENSPITCNVRRNWDPGLGMWSLSFQGCDKSMLNHVFFN